MARQHLDARGSTTDYITGNRTTGAVASLVGNVYIVYYEV